MDSKERRLLFLKYLRRINDAHLEERQELLESLTNGDEEMRAHLQNALDNQIKADGSVDPTSDTLVSEFDHIPVLSERPKGPHDLTGHRLNDKYRILKPLGRGAQGVVYLALNENLKDFVAIKVLTSAYQNFSFIRDRFAQEGQVLAKLRHPHICTVLDMDVSQEGWPFIVMEYLDGNTLSAHLKLYGAMDSDEVISVMSQVAEALKVAHLKSILHLDIKPSNIFLCNDEDSTVKLLDFGVAQLVSDQFGSSGGTMVYMSPEQIRGDDVTYSSDVWSLGVTALELLEGRHPVEAVAGGLEAYRNEVISDAEYNLPSAVKEAPREFRKFLKTCLKKKKEERFRTGHHVLETITTLKKGIDQRYFIEKLVKNVVLMACVGLAILGILFVVKPPQVIGGARDIGVTFAGGDALLSEGAQPVERWLAAELDHMIAEILTDHSRHRMVSKVELQALQTLNSRLLEFEVRIDADKDSFYVYMTMQDRRGLQHGMPQRISIRHDNYRQDRLAVYSATEKLLENQLDPIVLLPASAEANEDSSELKLDLSRTDVDSLIQNESIAPSLQSAEPLLKADTTWLLQGLYHLSSGNYEAAGRIFNSILLENPEFSPALISLAETEWYIGNPEEADRLFARADSLYPNDFTIMEWWAFLSSDRGYLDRADSLIQQCIALKPDEPASYRNWGAILIEKSYEAEDSDQKAAYVRMAKEALYTSLEFGEDAYAYSNLGYLLYNDEYFIDAANNFRRALALDTTDYTNWADLAYAFDKIPTRQDSAEYLMKKAMQIANKVYLSNPNDAGVLIDLARFNAELGDLPRAQYFREQYATRVIALEREDPFLEEARFKVDSLLSIVE